MSKDGTVAPIRAGMGRRAIGRHGNSGAPYRIPNSLSRMITHIASLAEALPRR